MSLDWHKDQIKGICNHISCLITSLNSKQTGLNLPLRSSSHLFAITFLHFIPINLTLLTSNPITFHSHLAIKWRSSALSWGEGRGAFDSKRWRQAFWEGWGSGQQEFGVCWGVWRGCGMMGSPTQISHTALFWLRGQWSDGRRASPSCRPWKNRTTRFRAGRVLSLCCCGGLAFINGLLLGGRIGGLLLSFSFWDSGSARFIFSPIQSFSRFSFFFFLGNVCVLGAMQNKQKLEGGIVEHYSKLEATSKKGLYGCWAQDPLKGWNERGGGSVAPFLSN